MNIKDIKKLVVNDKTVGGHGFYSLNVKYENEKLQKLEVMNSFNFISTEFIKRKFDFYYSYPNGGYTNFTKNCLGLKL